MDRFRQDYVVIATILVAHVLVQMRTAANLAILVFFFKELKLELIIVVLRHVRRALMQKYQQDHVKNVWKSASLVQIMILVIHGNLNLIFFKI